jgi:transcriptional regulator with XRE-family HTH domain
MEDAEEFSKRLGVRIRNLRVARGWSLKHIDDRGFNGSHWQQIERAYRVFNVATLPKICEVLEIDLKTLLTGLNDEGTDEDLSLGRIK